MARDPSQVAAKWATNLGRATEQIRQGVQAVQHSPTAKAAAQQAAYQQGVQDAVASGKWARGLNRVSLGDWQQATINRGLPRVGPGAQASQPKMQSFLADMLPFQDQVRNRVAAMSKATYEDRKARAAAMMDGMHQYKRQS